MDDGPMIPTNSITPAAPAPKLNHRNPGSITLNSPAFQEMDEYAPLRIAILLMLLAGSMIVFIVCKFLCRRKVPNGIDYQPLFFFNKSSGHVSRGGRASARLIESESSDSDTDFVPVFPTRRQN